MAESDALLALQDLDLEVMRAEKRLDELPEKRAILEARAKIAEVQRLKAKAELLVSKLEQELRGHQDEVSTLTEKLATEQKKVMETSDHRQVQAITREMDGLKRRRDKVEMLSLQLMERIDKADGQLAKVNAVLEQLGTKELSLVEQFKDEGGKLQSDIAALNARRDAYASQLPAETLERYRTVRDQKGGIGVGRLEDKTCSACRMELPAERIKELRDTGDPVGVCPECKRLIVVSEDS
jgi:predicted  nucleic acid-binding Zn-ribbon protein